MDMNLVNKVKKKRTINKQEWTKEKRKRLRIAGKEYINAKGEIIAEKAPGTDCKCRRKCYDRVPESTRIKLFNGYYALKSHDEQNAYLFGLIRKVPIARKRAEGSTRRTCTFNYYIRFGGQETQVCVKALANIHGVGKSKIHILCEKLGQNVLFPRDERGRHSKMPKKVSDDTVELAKEHIYSIIHSDRARDFLKDEKANNGPDVNITQMHKDFLDTYDPAFAQEMISYEKATGVIDCGNGDYPSDFLDHCDYRQSHGDYEEQNGDSSGESIQVIMDSEGNAHEVLRTDPNISQGQTITLTAVHIPKKKRRTTRDGRPEPLMRQWFYSKIFHDLYSTKEALMLRKKILNWKCSEDFIMVKPVRKQKSPKKIQGTQVQHVIVQEPIDEAQIMTTEQPQVQFIQARLNKGTNTFSIPITTQHIQPKKIPHEVQLQTIPLKKKQVQVFQTQGQDMYSIYPMILQDISQLEAHTVNSAQIIQPGQLRAIAPTHFQTTQQMCTPMTITTGALQTLGVNIGIAQNGAHYSTANDLIFVEQKTEGAPSTFQYST